MEGTAAHEEPAEGDAGEGALDPAAGGAESGTDLEPKDPSEAPAGPQNPVDPEADPIR